jgi:hypothetical protein
MDIHSLRVTGSLEVTGSLFVNGTSITSGGGASFPYTGSAIISGSLIVTGSILTDSDATINKLTVGLGGGSIGSNTAVGSLALSSNTTGTSNSAVGRCALKKIHQALVTLQ